MTVIVIVTVIVFQSSAEIGAETQLCLDRLSLIFSSCGGGHACDEE